MRAIDLYAGIGGWSLGLRLAGVQVVASYEWWKPAIATHNGNHGGEFGPVDVRKLDLDSLPTNIDLVVGSPPCTEFSYANRGGRGNIAEGMKDLFRFFEVVERLKPRFWAMENVPRVAEVLRAAFADPEHVLYRFRHLDPAIEIVDFSQYGTPQARRRCIATNIPMELVRSYQPLLPKRTLGDVLAGLAGSGTVTDPVWGVTIDAAKLTEMQVEPALNPEELRMNREAKEYHPVYNNMAFPDSLEQAARTVTATCTRVSRESIVIADPRAPNSFRRLTVRERACLQGFPITYQFYARSFAEKAKMIGNAIPPTFPYLLALAAQGEKAANFGGFKEAGSALALPANAAPVTLPDKEGKTYPASRSFRAALPGLRFKSGMRFELANSTGAIGTEWRVRFFFGSSKDIREVELEGDITRDLRRNPHLAAVIDSMRNQFAKAGALVARTSPSHLQDAWSHRCDDVHPYEIVDRLGLLAEELQARLSERFDDDAAPTIVAFVLAVAIGPGSESKLIGRSKLEKYAIEILAGLVIAEWFNTLDWHSEKRVAA